MLPQKPTPAPNAAEHDSLCSFPDSALCYLPTMNEWTQVRSDIPRRLAMSDERLVFLHLSDIHFSRRSGKPGDLDEVLRHELERDALNVRARFSTLSGVLVSGDVAFSGQQNEYETAKTWLSGLTRQLGCPAEAVWVVPGNHDVDREIVRKSKSLRALRQSLRPADPSRVDQEFSDLMQNARDVENLHEPFAEYNRFAHGYGCQVGVGGRLHWEHDLVLNDRSVLRLRGLNSALLAGLPDDNDADKRMPVSSLQSLPKRYPHVTYLFMCHHPPVWLWDRDKFDDNLKVMAALTLFGHKHTQRIETLGNTLRIHAGALQPDRGEDGWLPRYNVIALSVEGVGDRRGLRVDVLPRLWHDVGKEFRADFDAEGSDTITHVLPLGRWDAPAPPPRHTDAPVVRAEEAPAAAPLPAPTSAVEGRLMNPERRLTFRFFDLPYSRRMEVVQTLGLIEDDDEGVREEERYKRYFLRAKAKHLLGRMWEEVERRHADGETADNPFLQAR